MVSSLKGYNGEHMKYFKDKLWNNINSLDEETKKEAEKEWKKNTEKYFAYFQSILNCFTAEFLSAYYQYGNRRKFCVIDTHRQYENQRLSQEWK